MRQPEGLGYLVLDEILHGEDASQSATAPNCDVVQRPEGLSLEGLHEGVEVDSQEQPSFPGHLQGIPIGEILAFLLALDSGEVDSPPGACEIGEP